MNFKINIPKNQEREQKIIKFIIDSIGSMKSLLIHTILFISSFLLYFLGYNINNILLVLTTIVSLEAIYLSILIQMSVNIQSKITEKIQKDVEDIQENVEELQDDDDENII